MLRSRLSFGKKKKNSQTCIAEQSALHQWQYCSFQFHNLSSPRDGLVWLLAEFRRLKSDNIVDWVVY